MHDNEVINSLFHTIIYTSKFDNILHLNNHLNLLFGLANYKPVITQITHPQRNITTALVPDKKRSNTQFWVGMTDIRRANLNMPNIWMVTYK